MKKDSIHLLHDYEKICQQIWEHNKRYYIENSPTISDEEFDALLKLLVEIEKQHPEWIHPNSPTQRVNEFTTTGFQTVYHQVPMLSLANTYSMEEIEDFITRMHKLTGEKKLAFSCEIKMDGIAVSARFEKGIYVRGVTRGDGKKGDDVTANIKTIHALPLKLYNDNVPEILEVRGEVFMTHHDFKESNQQRLTHNEPLWANPRNAAAGSLKLLDPREVAKRNLAIAFYSIAEDSSKKLNSQSQAHAYLQLLGLPTLTYRAKCHSMDEIWQFAEHIRSIRKNLPYDIDGIVIKLDDLREQEHLGSTGKHPRWAVAYKFAAEQAITQIKNITVQVGRTGTLTPVAELEPVFLAGSTIARATLHNEEEIVRKDFRINDTVTIEKGGDVIPKVVSVHVALRPAHSVPWKMPEHCPACGAAVVKNVDEVAVRCPNPNCSEQQLKRLVYFAGKHAMDIDNMGEKVVEQLVTKGFIQKPSDIYKLNAEQLAQLESFKEKSIQNLLAGIERSKKVSLSRFIMALGIKHVGAGVAELLAKRAGSIDTLSKITADELQTIEGIGPKVANALVEYFSDQNNKDEISHLLMCGIAPQQDIIQVNVHHLFNGKAFVLTGTLNNYTRSAAAALIKERGGKVTESVSKQTDFLLIGHDAGSKLDKAKKLGIRVLTESEFEQLL